jgi:MULE transposase-like protein
MTPLNLCSNPLTLSLLMRRTGELLQYASHTLHGIGKTVSIAMCFVASESEPIYRAVSMIVGKIKDFLTDDDTSLKNALSAFYTSTPQFLCIWHINKNVETKVKKCGVSTMSDNAANK